MTPSKHEQDWIDRLDAETPPPPGMDWAAMRGGILEKMEPEEKPARRVVGWWWLPLVFMLGVWVALAVRPTYQAGEIVVEVPERSVESPPAAGPRRSYTTTSPGVPTPPRSASLAAGSSASASEGSVASPPPAARPRRSYTPASTGVPTPPRSASLGSALEVAGITPSVSERSAVPPGNILPVEQVATIAYAAVTDVDYVPNPRVEVVAEEPAAITPVKRTSLSLLAGSLLERPRLLGGNAEGADLRESSEREVGGYTAGLQLRRKLGDRWAGVVGLGYEAVDTRLDYDQVVREFDTLLVDVPVFVSSVTGVERRGDAITTARERRQVVHYNQRRRLTASLLGEYRLPADGLALSVQAGPVLGYALSASGRQVNGLDDIGPLAGYTRRFSLSGYAGLQLSLPVGTWELRGQLGLRQSLLHERTGGVSNARTGLLGSVGVGRRF